jgi:hypothetical protein
VRENPDGVNARKIFAGKCAEYSPTNEPIAAAFSLLRGNAVGRIGEAQSVLRI